MRARRILRGGGGFYFDASTLEGYTSVGTHREPAQEPPTFRGTTRKTSRSVKLESRQCPVRVPGKRDSKRGLTWFPQAGTGNHTHQSKQMKDSVWLAQAWWRWVARRTPDPSLATIKSIAWRPHASADADLSRAGGGGRKSPGAGRDCSSDTLSGMRDIDTRQVRETSTADVVGRYETGRRVKEW